MGRYAALYANKVILPLSLNKPSNVDDASQAVHELSFASLSLLHLRPLLDAGVVYPVVMRSFHCEHTTKWCDEMVDVVHRATDHMVKAFQREFVVRYQLPEKAPQGVPSIYIEGPEDFLEHGSIVQYFNEGKNWRLKSWKFDDDGMVELRGPRKLLALDYIFRNIAQDITFYLAYGRNVNSRFLTSLPGETIFLDGLTRDEELAASSEALQEGLTHSVPLLDDLSLAKLLSIRREERDSFARYRLAIQQIFSELSKTTNRVSKKEVREAFRERIEPELAKMKSELYQQRQRQVRRVVGGLGALAASVALGTFGGVVPFVAKAAATAAGAAVGTGLLNEAAKSRCEHGATLKEKNDFYFLLRLTQEAES